MQVMFDTNDFNHLVEGRISADAIPIDWKPIATHIQFDELMATGKPEKSKQFQEMFAGRVTETMPTETAVWDVSKYDMAKYGGPASRYLAIRAFMDAKRPHPNNINVALIADTCKQRGCTLVTNDSLLKEAAASEGIEVVDLAESSNGQPRPLAQ